MWKTSATKPFKNIEIFFSFKKHSQKVVLQLSFTSILEIMSTHKFSAYKLKIPASAARGFSQA